MTCAAQDGPVAGEYPPETRVVDGEDATTELSSAEYSASCRSAVLRGLSWRSRKCVCACDRKCPRGARPDVFSLLCSRICL